jgi:hypothetical protein
MCSVLDFRLATYSRFIAFEKGSQNANRGLAPIATAESAARAGALRRGKAAMRFCDPVAAGSSRRFAFADEFGFPCGALDYEYGEPFLRNRGSARGGEKGPCARTAIWVLGGSMPCSARAPTASWQALRPPPGSAHVEGDALTHQGFDGREVKP